MPAKKSTSKKEPGFEDALEQLEEIVSAMEEGELPLEELVDRFENGTRLLHRCQHLLDSAKKRLQTIAQPAETDPNDLTTGAEDDTDANSTDHDDIRLF